MIIIGYVASVAMGLSLGLIGGGGSILTVPILYYFFKQDSLLATTNSLFVVGMTALVGAILNARKGNLDIKMGVIFAVPSFVGVFAARHFLLPMIPDTLFSTFGLTMTKPLLVMITFAVLMIMASRAMIRSGRKHIGKVEDQAVASPNLFGVGYKGFLVGCTTGFVGAGGGFLIIPALVLLLKLPMRIAIGTSLAIIAANSLFGFAISESAFASANWQTLFSICALGIIGIFVGQILSVKIHDNHLKRGFGYFVLIVGGFILIDQVIRMF